MKNLFILLLLIPTALFAQVKKLFVDGSGTDAYITHVIQPKENFYSIGRIYNISPRVYAPYNNLALEGGLTIGETVKIPLNEINYSKDGSAADDEVIVPLYRRSGDLYGYLKVKKELSPLAANASAPKKSVAKAEPTTPAPTQTNTNPVKETTPVTPETTPEPKKEVVKSETPKAEPKVEEPKITSNKDSYFKSAFQKQKTSNTNITNKGAGFKSTSGWNDGKFYCFHNRAAAGSIIAITNPNNGKVIYAKVLDVIPDNSDNVGIDIKLSDAAVAALGMNATSFSCSVTY